MAEITTGGRPVSVTVPTVDFVRGMRGAKSEKAIQSNANLMTSVSLPLYTGKELEDDKRAQFPGGGRVDLNLGKLADMPGALLDQLGTKQAARCEYTGNTPDEKPVTINTVRNLSEQDPKRRDSVKLTMDLQAIANANDIERDKGRKEKGLDPYMTGDSKADRKNPALGRISVEMRSANSVDGVTGISADSVKYNLGQMAAQNYLLTASKTNPGANMVSKDAVATVGELYTAEFKAFAEKYADKDCTGIKANVKQADGSYKTGKEAIEGTKFNSLSSMGIKPVELDNGGMALVCVDGSDVAADKRKGVEGLVGFNNAFNKHFSQVVNSKFEKGSAEINIGNNIGVQLYPVNPPDAGTQFQPAITFQSRPYANMLTRSVECATHQNTKSCEDLYGKDVLANTREIQDYFPTKGDAAQKDAVSKELKDKLAAMNLSNEHSGKEEGPEY